MKILRPDQLLHKHIKTKTDLSHFENNNPNTDLKINLQLTLFRYRKKKKTV